MGSLGGQLSGDGTFLFWHEGQRTHQAGPFIALQSAMHALDRLIPMPRLLEIDEIEIAAPADKIWNAVRHADLARSPLIRALFVLRSLPARFAGRVADPGRINIDDMASTPEQPGFQVLSDDAPHEVAVGAIAKVWLAQIPFVHVANALEYESFDRPDFVKVAWALRLDALSSALTRLSIEVRVDASDEAAWAKFKHYFRVIGPASRFIRRTALKSLAKELHGGGVAVEAALPGDELLPDAGVQLTQDIIIRSAPQKIWPWLQQMGCDRAGFYSLDRLDNGAVPSARKIHPEWQTLEVGQRVSCRPDGSAAFEVLRSDVDHTLVLGLLFDAGANQQLGFAGPRTTRYWHVTWAFILEPVSAHVTRLRVRARAAFTRSERLHAIWIRPLHYLMESVQLHNLRARVEESTLPSQPIRLPAAV